MIYECEIKGVDEEEVIIEIDGIEIVCFCNSGCNYSIGYHTTCELDLFGDLLIEESQDHEFLERKANTYSYNVVGVLDVENKLLRSCIDFSINEYLDLRKISVNYLYKIGLAEIILTGISISCMNLFSMTIPNSGQD